MIYQGVYQADAVAAVVLLCGSPKFVQDFMYTAEDMQMIDPDEYLYLMTMHNVKDIARPWRGTKTRRRADPTAAFKPVLQV